MVQGMIHLPRHECPVREVIESVAAVRWAETVSISLRLPSRVLYIGLWPKWWQPFELVVTWKRYLNSRSLEEARGLWWLAVKRCFGARAGAA